MSEEKHCLYNVKLPFPFKLHEMLEDVERSGKSDIVSWQPHGKAFRVHKRKEFVSDVMPHYFKQTQYKSFQRQLHLYGFHRINGKRMADYGAYYNDRFVRGKKQEALKMVRCKIKGHGGIVNPYLQIEEPNFYNESSGPITSELSSELPTPVNIPSSDFVQPMQNVGSFPHVPFYGGPIPFSRSVTLEEVAVPQAVSSSTLGFHSSSISRDLATHRNTVPIQPRWDTTESRIQGNESKVSMTQMMAMVVKNKEPTNQREKTPFERRPFSDVNKDINVPKTVRRRNSLSLLVGGTLKMTRRLSLIPLSVDCDDGVPLFNEEESPIGSFAWNEDEEERLFEGKRFFLVES